MKMTSAYANKMLKQLNGEKEYYMNLEQSSNTYTVLPGEEAIVPEYDYRETANKIAEIDNKIANIKHAINEYNVETYIDITEEERMSIDEALVRMAQLTKRKEILNQMRKQPKVKVNADRFGGATTYQYINYDLDTVKKEYDKVSQDITNIQLALDKHNQLDKFEIEI